jgi:hypothetical protein
MTRIVKKSLEKLSSFNETFKLYIYSKIKSELKLENYLLFFANFKMRQLFTKFRSECFIEEKGLVKFSKSVISRSNSLKIFPMKKNYAKYRFHQNQQIYR